jgi:DNA (cytosine-5)-methyltransferase 1
MWKVLNLYAGIGGNRKLWEDVEVTAVEWDEQIARIYKDFFPDDIVIKADAHQFLLEHYKEFDFIWSSPPCPTHSRARFWSSRGGLYEPIYPDMSLYQEIIFLDNYYDGLYCIENVKGYYEPLIKPQVVDRHYYWANFYIPDIRLGSRFNIQHNKIDNFEETIGFDLSPYEGVDKKNIMRNCVDPRLGEHVLDCARNITQTKLYEE